MGEGPGAAVPGAAGQAHEAALNALEGRFKTVANAAGLLAGGGALVAAFRLTALPPSRHFLTLCWTLFAGGLVRTLVYPLAWAVWTSFVKDDQADQNTK